MGDEQRAVHDEPFVWAADADDDPSIASSSFGDPVEWPDAIEWPVSAEPEETAAVPVVDLFPDDHDAGIPPASPPVDAFPGGAPTSAPGDAHLDDLPGLQLEPIPESIWDAPPEPDEDTRLIPAAPGPDATALPTVTTTPEAPRPSPSAAVYAEPERHGARRPLAGLDLRRPSAAFVGLAALAALVLIAFAFSVRTRSHGAGTDTQAGPANGKISAQGLPVSTLGTTTTATSSPPSSINLGDLVPADSTPPPDAGTAADAGTAGGGATPRAATTGGGTPARAASPSGSGSGGGSSTPAASGGTPAPASGTDSTPAAAPAPADPSPAPPASSSTGPTSNSDGSSQPPVNTTRTTRASPDVSFPSVSMPTTEAPSTPTSRPRPTVPMPTFPPVP